jgi:hypothetical protein
MDINASIPSNFQAMLGTQVLTGGPGVQYVPHVVPTEGEISPVALAAIQGMFDQHMQEMVPRMAAVCTHISAAEVSKQLEPVKATIDSHSSKLTEVVADLEILKAERLQHSTAVSVLNGKMDTLLEELQRLRRLTSGASASTSQAADDKGGWDGLTVCVFGVKFFDDAGLRAAEIRRVKGLICTSVDIDAALVTEVSILGSRVRGAGDARVFDLKMKCLSEAAARSIIMKANLIWSEHHLGICEWLPRNLETVRRERLELVRQLRVKKPDARWTMWGINIMMNNTFTPGGASPGERGIWVRRDDIEALKAELGEAGAMEVGSSG